MNQCNFIGNVGQDPETRFTKDGKAIATISLATTKKWKDHQGQKQEKTTWIRCQAFDKKAELIQQYVGKGSKLAVTCEYSTAEYNDQTTGEKKYLHNFTIQNMEFLGGGKGGNQQAPQQPQHQASQNYQAPVNNQQPQQPVPQYAPNDFDDDDVPF